MSQIKYSNQCHVQITPTRSIFIQSAGTGKPLVVLVSGLGERADNWMIANDNSTPVFQGVAEFTRVCAYDRPGTATETSAGLQSSRSTQRTCLATIADSAEDLNAFLINSGEPPPYILVGHSLGGDIIRLYANNHPNKVAGFVFVDTLSEELGNFLTQQQLADFKALNDPVQQGRPAYSEHVFYSEAVVPLIRNIKYIPIVPTIVLSGNKPPISPKQIASGDFPPFVTQQFADALSSAQLIAQDLLAAQFPYSKHVMVDSGHYIHLENPKLVINSIYAVYNASKQQQQQQQQIFYN